MKNLNSFQFIARAVEYEFRRQVEALEAGEEIIQETRRFDQASGKTFSMRRKEDANDYRYFRIPICRRLRYPRIFCGNSRPRSPCCRIREKGVCKAVWPD